MSARVFVSLGDSISIDLYPEIDYAQRTGKQAKKLGAASLLHRNADDVWPEFAGRDIASHVPGSGLIALASDGATIHTVRSAQLSRVPRGAAVITLTVGGNDLLVALGNARERKSLDREVARVQDEFRALAATLARLRPDVFIITNVYDPTDGTGRLHPLGEKLPLELLDSTNAVIEDAAREVGAELADIHAHFLGHGATARPREMWYWPESIIEPGYRGASEVRRLWWDCLERSGAV